MLVVKETPVSSDQGIQDGDATVKGKLGDLRGLKLAVGIAELDNSGIFFGVVTVRDNTVVSGLLDGVFDGARLLQVDSLCGNEVLGLLRGIGCQDEFANVSLVAVAGLDVVVAADSKSLDAHRRSVNGPNSVNGGFSRCSRARYPECRPDSCPSIRK